LELGYISRMSAVFIDNYSVQWSNLTDAAGLSVSAIVTLQMSTQRVFLADDEEVTFKEDDSALPAIGSGV